MKLDGRSLRPAASYDYLRTGEYENCKSCGKFFYVQKKKVGRAKYCSLPCKYRATTKGDLISCKTCGKKFYVPPVRIQRGAKFCSKKCEFVRSWHSKEYLLEHIRDEGQSLRKISEGLGVDIRTVGSVVAKLKIRELISDHCQICSKKFGGGVKSHLDHDHSSGRYRGVLCESCNRGLGFFFDSPELLESAIGYLNKSRDKLIDDIPRGRDNRLYIDIQRRRIS